MIIQELNPKKVTTGQGIKLLFLIIIAMVVTGLLVSLLVHVTGIGLWDVLYILVAGFMVYRILVVMLRGYRYTYSDGVLSLERRYGDTTRSFIQIEGQDMLSLHPGDQRPDASIHTVMKPQDSQGYWLLYLSGGQRNAVAFAPNADLVAALTERIAGGTAFSLDNEIQDQQDAEKIYE